MTRSRLLVVFFVAELATAQQRLTEGELKVVSAAGLAGEGPSWDPAGILYFTGPGKISRLTARGRVESFRDPSPGANGSSVDPQRRVIVGEDRKVIRIDRDGSVTVLADNYEGKKFNAPNDTSLDSKGRIYFSDPRYENRDNMEMQIEGVYRIDAPGKVTRIIAGEVNRPNGVLVTPGDRYLYVADNNNNIEGGARKLWRFDLNKDGTVSVGSKKLIYDWGKSRGPDGLKMDRQGRLYVAAGRNQSTPFEITEHKSGVYILSPDGKLLEFVAVPTDETTNVAFGGADLKTLFITSGGTLYSIRTKTAGRITAR